MKKVEEDICEKCRSFAYAHGQAIMFPWLHCHHEEANPKCEICLGGSVIPTYCPMEPGVLRMSNFCPKCGRDLRPEWGKT